jgi:SAM-dependent methyltransferase
MGPAGRTRQPLPCCPVRPSGLSAADDARRCIPAVETVERGPDTRCGTRRACLGSPLPFPDDTFDDVTASLVLHYLEDWGPALAELRRVLKPGGR